MPNHPTASHEVAIESCVPCDFRPQAIGLARELREVRLLPSAGGRFEVTLDGELIFSRAALERHAAPGGVTAAVAARLGPLASVG